MSNMKSSIVKLFALTFLVSITASPVYAEDFIVTANEYNVLTGDYDGDSLQDIYLRPKSTDTDITIPYDVVVNVPIESPIGHLVLQRNANGSYTLINNPSMQQLQLVAFSNNPNYEFIQGDFDGDGFVDTLIRSTLPTADSFLLQSGSGPKDFSLVQQISENEFTVPVSEATISVSDINGDGRSDITLTATGGETESIFGSSSGGLVQGNSPNTGTPPSIDPHTLTTGVGAIPGSASISAVGKLNYSIPLRMPPSITGIAPQLAFTYSGQSSDGMMGVGWYVDGLSSISRCATTYDQDGYIDGVNFNDSDKYCLNGQRLIAISGAYGRSNTEYRTESESYTRIVSFNYSTSAKGPAYFRVWRATGEIETYGNGGNSNQTDSTGVFTNTWNISRREDREGNYATYSYASSATQGEHYITNIAYTGNGSTLPQTELNFLYEGRADVTPGTPDSTLTVYRRRLARVETNVKNEKIREYRLNYQSGASTRKSQLSAIVDCSFSGTTEHCLPATSFSWQQFSNIVEFAAAGESSDSTRFTTGANINNAQYHLTDVNADGRNDIVATYRESNNLKIILYSGNAAGTGFDFVSETTETGFFATLPVAQPPEGEEGVAEEQQRFFTGDVNGDGRADLIYVARHLTDVYRTIYLANSTGTGFIDQGYQVDSDVQYQDVDLAEFEFGDVNGDGRTDFIFIFAKDDTFGTVVYHANEDASGNVYLGKASSEVIVGEYSPKFYNNNNFITGDVNGDRKTDLLWVFTLNEYIYRVLFLADDNGGKFYNVSTERDSNLFTTDVELRDPLFQLGDVNADGKADLVWTAKRGTEISRTVYISAEAGNRFVRVSNVQDTLGGLSIGSHSNDSIRLLDINADGRSDLIYTYTTATNRFGWVSLVADSNGNGFSIGDSDEITGADDPGNVNHQYLLGDMNFDGRPDMVWLYNDSRNALFQRVYTLPKAYPDHITSITNGFGVQHLASYAYLADPAEGIYTRDNTATYPLREDAGEGYVVKTYLMSNGIGGLNRYNYDYGMARTHLRGRGFVGFENRVIEDLQTGFDTTEHYSQSYPLIGRVESSVTINTDTALPTTKTFNHWKTQSIPWGGGNTRLPYMADAVTIQYELDGAETSTSLMINTYDFTSGNLVQKRNIVGYGFTGAIDTAFNAAGSFVTANVTNNQLDITTNNTYTVDLGVNWRPGFLVQEQNIYNGYNDSSSRTVTTQFDPINASSYLTQQERRFVGSDVEVTTTFTRDAFGNITAISTTGADLTGTVGPYTESMGPYADGLYSQGSSNRVGHTESYTYDERTGNRTRLVDVNALNNFMLYDDFGRQVVSRTPTGATSQSTYAICDECAPNSEYSVTTVTTSSLESGVGSPTTVIYYDQFDREVQRDTTGFDGTLIRVSSRYDNRGRMISQTEPFYVGDTAPTKTFAYDDYNRQTREIQADGGQLVTTYSIDAAQSVNRSRQIQNYLIVRPGLANATVTTTTWADSTGRITRTVDAENILTELEYDAQGNLSQAIIDGNAATTVTINTDVAGNKTRIVDPDVGVIQFEFDGLGNERRRSHLSDEEIHQITNTYDAIGRLLTRTDDDGTNASVSTWTYDVSNGIGQIATASGYGQADAYAYDSLSRVSRIVTDLVGIAESKTFTLTYDAYDRLRTKAYPSEFSIENEYNANGYLASTIDSSNNEAIWTATAQDARTNYTREQYGNGLLTSRDYDVDNGNLLTIETGTSAAPESIQNINVQYDTAGNVYTRSSARSSVPGENLLEAYTYDNIHRLQSASMSGLASGPRNVTFSYDNLGNILQKSDYSNQDGYSYAQGGASIHAVTSVGTASGDVTYTYDFKGNMVTRGEQALAFAVFNKPINISGPGFQTDFTYGPERQRFHQKHVSGSRTRDTYYYQNREFEIVIENGVVREKTYIGNYFIHVKASLFGAAGYSEDSRYLHMDHIGSKDAVTDANGVLISRYAFDTHGRRLESDWERPQADFDTQLASLTFDNTAYGFTGQEELLDSGLIHMNGRVYDPLAGRFLSPDIFVQIPTNGQNYNRYSYVLNNPTSLRDPSGQFFFLVPGIIIAYKAYNAYEAVQTGIDAYNTFQDENASDLDKAVALGTVATDLLGLKKFREGGKALAKISSQSKVKNTSKKANSSAGNRKTAPNAKSNSPDDKVKKKSESDGSGGSGNKGGNGDGGGSGSNGDVPKGADDFVDLTSPARRRHILDGDATGGGHRPGTGKPGKSEFPAGRSDDSIIHDISDIATDPTLKSRPGRGGRTITDGTRNGVDIRVIQERNGDIVTGFATNTPRNPR